MEQHLLGLEEHSQALYASGTWRPDGKHSRPDLTIVRSRLSPILQFLREVCQQLLGWLLANWKSITMDSRCQTVSSQVIDTNQQIVESLHDILTHWHSTFDVALAPTFQEATLYMHIRLWSSLVAKYDDAPELYRLFLEKIQTSLKPLESSWRLTIGLSMERLWATFRPITPSNLQQLQTLLQLEYLASQFQAAVWKTSQPLEYAVQLHESLNKAIESVLKDDSMGGELIKVALPRPCP